MGTVEVYNNSITINSHIITYGDAATPSLTALIREEIETIWNEPTGRIRFNETEFIIQFRITAELNQHVAELEVLQNTDPRNNYFRIEEFSKLHISFVDGLGCNTGYFKADNLLPGWTTAAHEYGHTLGLDHPKNIDLRGKGRPGIMYPRGTLVDPEFQYDPTKPAGVTGGTMHPMHRKVTQSDIDHLKIEKLLKRRQFFIGAFTNLYHPNHADMGEDFTLPPVAG